MATRTAKQYRFDARLNESQKLLLQRAADLEGRSLTDFILRSAEAAAAQTINSRSMLLLNARESQEFARILLAPPQPGAVLRKAAKRYRKQTGL